MSSQEKCNTHEVGHGVSKLCVELIDERLDQPIAINRIVYDLLHGSTDGEEVLVLFILKQKKGNTLLEGIYIRVTWDCHEHMNPNHNHNLSWQKPNDTY